MRTVGIRTLKNEATTLLQTNETLIVERHGTPVGVYVPLAARDRAGRATALLEFGAVLRDFLLTHGLTEEEVAAALTEPVHDDEPTDAPGH